MADEQLYLTIEQFAEAVRTSMTREYAEESLESLGSIIEKENNEESISHGRLHEVAGQVFRSLLPAFVMTDADFKAPASLAAPTKAMQVVKDASVDWVIRLCKQVPAVATAVNVDRVAYRRRMRMTVNDDIEEPEQVEGIENNENWSDEDDANDDENTPPNDDDEEESVGKKKKKAAKKPEPDPPSKSGECESVALDPVVALLERMAVRCPDKTEWRRSVCDSVGELSKSGVMERYVSGFLLNLANSDKAAWRIFSCEAISVLVQRSPAIGPVVFDVLLVRCRDAVPGVRSVAMKSAASVFVAMAMQRNLNDSLSAETEKIVQMFNERSIDEKPSVRRSAISVFDALVPIVGTAVIPLRVLEQLSLDESLMVRKSSIASIVDLLLAEATCASIEVTSLWARSVLHMVTDVESTVVEKVVESVEICVINPINAAAASIKKIEDSISPCPAPLLAILTSMAHSKDSIEFAKRAIKIIVRKLDQRANKQIAASIEKILAGSYATSNAKLEPVQVSLWSLLEEIATTSPTVSVLAPARILSLVPATLGSPATLIPCLKIVQVMFSKQAKIEIEQKARTMSLLESLVKIPQPSLAVLHDAVRAYHAGLTNPLEYEPKIAVKTILESVLSTAETAIDTVVLGGPGFDIGNTHELAWYVSLIGELASLGHMPSARGLTAIEAIGTNRVYHNSGVDHFPLPPSLRSAAMVAFGRICLEKESIAKRSVSKFAAHLSREEHPVVRNNVLIVLGDLCVVYTGMVDQYLAWVTACLADPNDLIRFQAAVVVSSLLAEDYIKFKGQLVFRLLYLLSDPNPKIRYFMESVFARILFLRHSGSLKTLFAETVCALNGFSRHPAFQGALGNRDFFLTTDRERRLEIYRFMLTNVVTTEQKFNAVVQLANSLLAAFVDEDATNGAVFIPEREDGAAGQVIIDTLYLLSCKELKLSAGGVFGGAQTAPGEDPTADPEDKDAREKRLFEAALQKKSVVENLVPLLIQLNSLCEQKRSSISWHVRECLKELIKDYKDEIGQIVHADLQLAQELIYDLNAGQPEVPAAIADALPVEATQSAATKSSVPAAESAESALAKKPAPAVEVATGSSEAEPEPQPRKSRRKAEPPKEESPKPVRASRRGRAQPEPEVKEEEEQALNPRPSRKRRGAN